MINNGHKVQVGFEDGRMTSKLICPGEGCSPPTSCAYCGSPVGEPEGCDECKDGALANDTCWLVSWFENTPVDELLSGEITFPITTSWGDDAPVVEILDPAKVAI